MIRAAWWIGRDRGEELPVLVEPARTPPPAPPAATGPVSSRNVTKFAMPTMSTPAPNSSGYVASGERTMNPP